jgi:hypothetical protein
MNVATGQENVATGQEEDYQTARERDTATLAGVLSGRGITADRAEHELGWLGAETDDVIGAMRQAEQVGADREAGE